MKKLWKLDINDKVKLGKLIENSYNINNRHKPLISKTIYLNGDKINKAASAILHRDDLASEKEAKDIIETTKDFLEEMFEEILT